MKAKLGTITISVLLVLGLLAAPVVGQSALSVAQICLDPTPVEAGSGQAFTVTLKIDSIPEPGMAAYDFRITFTPGVIEFATGKSDHEWPDPDYGQPFVFNVDNSAGYVSFNDICTDIPAPSGNITLVVLHGTAVATESLATSLHFDKGDILDPDGERIAATVTDGGVEVLVQYDLTMAADPVAGGTATDLTDGSPYPAGANVSIRAEAAAGYRFVEWTAPAGTFGNASAAETIFTMPAQVVAVTAHFELVELPPEEAIEDLIDCVQGLELSQGNENSLVHTLQAAIRSLDRGRTNAAANQLQAFINHVDALRNKKLSDKQATDLIDRAQDIIDRLR